MLTDGDQFFLRRALSTAMRGRGTVEPNPMVGCVIVRDNRIIGEGIHERFGQLHAEPAALAACVESAEGATAYVTLEPCCHLDKQTPPCVPRLIAAKVARVVIGCLDPNPRVNGRGLAQLREAGLVVDVAPPDLEAQARQLIAPFIARTIFHRPYVTLKWAQSRNGKLAGPLGERVRITNDASNRVIQALRGRCDAIAVGTNTVLRDDPLLTVRAPSAESRKPIRVVLSNSLKLPIDSQLVRTANDSAVVLFCSEASASTNADAVKIFRDRGVEIVALPNQGNHFSFAEVLAHLHARCVSHLLIEPGPTLAKSLFAEGVVDRVWVFTSKMLLPPGGLAMSPMPTFANYRDTGAINIAGDELVEYLNPTSDCFFARMPSPDFQIVRRSEDPSPSFSPE